MKQLERDDIEEQLKSSLAKANYALKSLDLLIHCGYGPDEQHVQRFIEIVREEKRRSQWISQMLHLLMRGMISWN